MDSDTSNNGSSAQGRVCGIILSPYGWQRFQVAKQQAESAQSWGKHFTQEDLSDQTGLHSIRSIGCLNANWESLA